MKKEILKYANYAILIALFLLLIQSEGFRYLANKIFDPNEKVLFIESDEITLSTYVDISNLPEFRGRPSLIFTNSRFDFGWTEKEALAITRLKNTNDLSNINFIYAAMGLEDESDNKIKWHNKMKEFNVEGYHISLPDEFKEYHSLSKVSKNKDGHTNWNMPKYIITNSSSQKVDVIYSLLHKSESAQQHLLITLLELSKKSKAVASP